MAKSAAGSRAEKVNKMNPPAFKAKLGDTVADLVTQVNALTVALNATLAKLDADAGVTDVNYTALGAVPATALASLEAR